MPSVPSERLAVGLLFVVVAGLACLVPAQSDTWWLLRAGQDIWRSGTVLLEDTYSHTAAGLFWPNHEWLTEVIFFGAHQLGGMPLLAGFCASLVVLACGLSWRLTGGAFELRFLLFAGCLAPAVNVWAIRPQVLSLFLFALVGTLLAANRIRWLPVLFVLWTNLHGAVALGVVAVTATLVADVIRLRRVPWQLVGITAGCVIATVLSPLGLRLWTFIAESTEKSRVSQLIEWAPPGFSPPLWPFWAVAAALPIVAVMRRHRLEVRTSRLLAISLAILPLAVNSQRNVAVFLLTAVPAMSCLLAGSQPRARGARREHGQLNGVLLALATVGMLVFVTLVWLRPPPSLGWRPISPEAVLAIRDCPERIYNTYRQGGVLIWFVPERRVFIDNRQDPYPISLLTAARQIEFGDDHRAVFDAHNIRCAVLSPGMTLASRLANDPAWTETHADDRWQVFQRLPQ